MANRELGRVKLRDELQHELCRRLLLHGVLRESALCEVLLPGKLYLQLLVPRAAISCRRDHSAHRLRQTVFREPEPAGPAVESPGRADFPGN